MLRYRLHLFFFFLIAMHLEDFFLPLIQAALPNPKKLVFAFLPLRLPSCLVEHGALCRVGDKQFPSAPLSNVGP